MSEHVDTVGSMDPCRVIESALEDIALYYEQAADPGRARGMNIIPTGGSSESPSRPPMPVDTLSLREEVRACLASWALLVIEERDLRGAHDGNDAVGLATWLKLHAPYLAEQEYGYDAAEELATWAKKLRLTAAPPEDDRGIFVADTPDGGRLVRVEDPGPKKLMQLEGSYEFGTSYEWFRKYHPDLDVPITIADLAKMDGVSDERTRDRLRNAKLSRLNPGEATARYNLLEYRWYQHWRKFMGRRVA